MPLADCSPAELEAIAELYLPIVEAQRREDLEHVRELNADAELGLEIPPAPPAFTRYDALRWLHQDERDGLIAVNVTRSHVLVWDRTQPDRLHFKIERRA